MTKKLLCSLLSHHDICSDLFCAGPSGRSVTGWGREEPSIYTEIAGTARQAAPPGARRYSPLKLATEALDTWEYQNLVQGKKFPFYQNFDNNSILWYMNGLLKVLCYALTGILFWFHNYNAAGWGGHCNNYCLFLLDCSFCLDLNLLKMYSHLLTMSQASQGNA